MDKPIKVKQCEHYEEKVIGSSLVDWCKKLKNVVCCAGHESRCWIDKRSEKAKQELISRYRRKRKKEVIK